MINKSIEVFQIKNLFLFVSGCNWICFKRKISLITSKLSFELSWVLAKTVSKTSSLSVIN